MYEQWQATILDLIHVPALLLRMHTFCIAQLKARWLSEFQQVMGPGQQNFFLWWWIQVWEVKFLGYLRIQHLHQIILSPTHQSDDMDLIEKNATVFA